MTQNEYIADLLMEAADALDESAGRNGLYKRYVEHNLANEKKKNDEIDAKHNMYKRAGYGEKQPKADRFDENLMRGSIRAHDAVKGMAQNAIKRYGKDDKYTIDSIKRAREVSKLPGYLEDKLNREERPLHKRINDRARKAQNECVADLLMEAAVLLMEDDEY